MPQCPRPASSLASDFEFSRVYQQPWPIALLPPPLYRLALPWIGLFWNAVEMINGPTQLPICPNHSSPIPCPNKVESITALSNCPAAPALALCLPALVYGQRPQMRG